MNDKTRIEIASGFKSLAPTRLGEGVRDSFSIIGIKGKVWSLRHQGETYYFMDDDNAPLPYIDVVILGENPNITKTYYPQGTYTEDSNNPPTCSAVDGDVPDPGVPIPQSTTCRTCKRNVWTTIAQTGRPGKECRDSKRLAVLLMPAMTEKLLGAPLNKAVMLRIPPASLVPLKSYSNSLIHRGVHNAAAVVTRIRFEHDKQFQMKFDLKQPLTNAEVPVIMELIEDTVTQVILGGQTAMRDVTPQLPPRETRTDTGILAAFGKDKEPAPASNVQTMPTRRGRPPGSTNKPKAPVVEPDGSPDEPPPLTAAQAAIAEQADVPWEEADSQVDATLAKVMQDMMK